MFKLSEKHRYSSGERRLFALLPQDSGAKKNGVKSGITSTMLAATLFGRRQHGRTQVIGLAKGLQQKLIRYREPFRLIQTERRGPHPAEIWLEGRK